MKDIATKYILFLISSFFLILNSSQVLSAIFCVGTASELSTALSTATSNGEDDIIRVQQGTYNGNFIYASTEAFGVTIEGGYTTGCASRVIDATNTVLDAGGSGPVLVLTAPDASATFDIEGTTIQNGYVTSTDGGGLYLSTNRGNVTIKNNTIKNNFAINNPHHGGGVYIWNAETIIIDNNMIMSNTAHIGGGIQIGDRCRNIYIINNEFLQNSCSYVGGGITITPYQTESINIVNNTFSQNNAESGGGIRINVGGTTVISLVNNIINNNSALSGGGGIYLSVDDTVNFINNTIAGNSIGTGNGGGVLLMLREDISTANLYNNVIFNNDGAEGADLFILNDYNNNYFNSVVNLYNNNFDQSLSGTYIQIPFPIDPSNLNNVDPLFVDSDNDNYHLTADSPLIDKGNNLAPELPSKDKDGKPRIIDGDYDGVSFVDIGAYEFGSPRGDLDGDGDVDGEDLRIFAESYGTYVGPQL